MKHIIIIMKDEGTHAGSWMHSWQSFFAIPGKARSNLPPVQSFTIHKSSFTRT
jgi:hypothetical protein